MKYTLRLFGFEVASLERDETGESCDEAITGGSMHNFDRDLEPVDPTDRYNWDFEDRKIGFR